MSKSCFIKIQKQDFLHKKWIFILSAFANICLIFLTFLFLTQEESNFYNWQYCDPTDSLWKVVKAERISYYFTSNIFLFGGLIAIVGALIVGIYSLKHLFWQKTQDTFGSLPINRNTQFFVIYLNGLYAFWIPFSVTMAVVMIAAVGKLNTILHSVTPAEMQLATEKGRALAFSMGHLVQSIGKAYIIIFLMYLTVYHLVLLAAGLSGNIMNTVVLTGMIGITPTIWGYIWKWLCISYFSTFVNESIHQKYLFAVSPMGNVLLKMFGGEYELTNWMLLVWSVILFVLAFLMYGKRPSEWAEKGLEIPWLRTLLQLLTTAASGICGWQVMKSLVENVMYIGGVHWFWCALGALLGGIICFGVENMIFTMNPKAFLIRKKCLVIALLGCAGVIAGFQLDIVHYDTYLPAKEDIAYMGLKDSSFTMYGAYDTNAPELEKMKVTDVDTIYEYLANEVEKQKMDETDVLENYYYDKVKVTLKNGRSYYRYYLTYYGDREIKEKILCNPEFYNITLVEGIDELMQTANMMYVRRISSEDYCYISTETTGSELPQNKENIQKILKALKQDLEEEPQRLWREEDKLLCNVEVFRMSGDEYYYSNGGRISFDVREGMTHTIAALREQGYGEQLAVLEPKQVQSITFTESSDLLSMQYDAYDYLLRSMGNLEEAYALELPADDRARYIVEREMDSKTGVELVKIIITDPEEIAELMKELQYTDSTWLYGMTRDVYESVECETAEGSRYLYFLRGAIPNKYMRRIIDALGE